MNKITENNTKVKVLLVDDKPENLFSLEAILEAEDREIFTASSGNEGLKLAIRNDFALILSDVQMPGMDGFEMVEILRTNPKNMRVPVIFVTAISKEEKYVHKGYSEGAVDYLFKPLDPTVVRAKTDIFISLYQQKQMLKNQKEELQRLNGQKNKFIGMAAHDLRNPLGVLQYFTKMFLEDTKESLKKEYYQYMETMHSTANFMMNLVDELLDISKIESGTFTLMKQNVDPYQLINEAVEINRIFSQRKSITINASLEENIPDLMLDYGKITQVLNNLISNAIKYAPHHTSIQINARSEKNNLVIEVIDQGQGIPANEIDKLFQPFQITSVRGTAGEKSTGLGLTIVAKMIEAHLGTIQVESAVGKGSTFRVRLPIIKSIEVVTKAQPIGEIDYRIAKRKEILVCEDNVMLQSLMKNVLQVFDVNVHFAANGKEGLKILLNRPEIDLVFTDINMPIMGGMELMEEIKKLNIKAEVIVLTASLNDEIIEQSNQSGSHLCLEKPISRAALKELLSEKK